MSFSLIWPTVGVPQKIAADQIHVWAWLLDSSLSLTAPEEAQIGLLDAKELERFHRFHFACDRARFAIAHVNVRRILGAYLDREPERLLFPHQFLWQTGTGNRGADSSPSFQSKP